MAVLDFLINKKPLRKQRDRAKDFAREAYNPNVVDPQLDVFRQLASEGINAGQENIARTRTIESLFRDQDFSLYGGNQSRAIAGSQATTQGAQRALSSFEANLTEQDIAAMQRGEQGVGDLRSKKRQIMSQRDAALKEADLQYEAAVERRGQQLDALAIGVLGTILTTPFGGTAGAVTGASVLERLMGGMFGDGGKEPQMSGVPNLELDSFLGEVAQDSFDMTFNNTPSQQEAVSGGGVASNTPEKRGVELLLDIFNGKDTSPIVDKPEVEDNFGLDFLNQLNRDSLDMTRDSEPFEGFGGAGTPIRTSGAGGSWDTVSVADIDKQGSLLWQAMTEDDPTLLGEKAFDRTDKIANMFGPVGDFAHDNLTYPMKKLLNFLNIIGRATQTNQN